MTSTLPIITIDLKQLRKPADNGVARASVFLGLASNATNIEPPISHVLTIRHNTCLIRAKCPKKPLVTFEKSLFTG
jgi:hypothetical protein